MLQRIWKICGSVSVTLFLLLLVSFNLTIASFYVKCYPQIFRPLNNFLLQDWFRFYGQNNPDKIWWLWTMFGLLFALGFNTGICTLDRIRNLLARRHTMDTRGFLLKITPSLIHICFLIMLSGHLISMISGFNKRIPVGPELETPPSIQAQLLDQRCDYFRSPELLTGQLDQCMLLLKLYTGKEEVMKQLSFLNPFTYQGFSFHLIRDKKTKEGGLQIIIKRDPGLKFILFGFTLLVLLMLWYFPTLPKNTKGD
jgi:hypothetical protein